MREKICFMKLLRVSGPISVVFIFFLFMSPPMETYAMDINTNATRQNSGGTASGMNMWKLRTEEVTRKEFLSYLPALIMFIKKRKGWNIGEYRVNFRRAFANAPLVVFDVMHKDRIEYLRKNPPIGFVDEHPLSMQIYIQTEELRAFDDPKEFDRIMDEWANKAKEAEQ